MCFKRKKKQARLEKKEEPIWKEWIKWGIKTKEFWILTAIIIIIILLIIFALHESTTYFVYNRGL